MTKKQTKTTNKTVKYNLGSGSAKLDGWENLDIGEIDLSIFPWSIESDTAEEILASHILEHFQKETGKKFLAECHRALKTGGKLHVAVPDMDIFIDCRNSGDWTPLGSYHWRDFNDFFGGGNREPRPEMRHYYMYNVETLTALMVEAGFSNVEKRPPLDEDNAAYHAISLYMTGTK